MTGPTLRWRRSEAGLLQYLLALHALKGSPHLRTLHHITSLRLQVSQGTQTHATV